MFGGTEPRGNLPHEIIGITAEKGGPGYSAGGRPEQRVSQMSADYFPRRRGRDASEDERSGSDNEPERPSYQQ